LRFKVLAGWLAGWLLAGCVLVAGCWLLPGGFWLLAAGGASGSIWAPSDASACCEQLAVNSLL